MHTYLNSVLYKEVVENHKNYEMTQFVFQVQLERTIWSKVDDSSIHHVMDLKQFEETFSAYQRKEADGGLGGGTLRRRSVLDRPKELSVIEGKRAQNCSIVLSTLKMTNEEVREF